MNMVSILLTIKIRMCINSHPNEFGWHGASQIQGRWFVSELMLMLMHVFTFQNSPFPYTSQKHAANWFDCFTLPLGMSI